jgi:uncharacterized protein
MTTPVKFNQFIWNELATSRPDVCRAFYGRIFGWQTQEVDLGDFGTYSVLMHEGQGIGGMLHMDEADGEQAISFWTSYVAVEDVDALAEEAMKAGGTIKLPPTNVPELGRVAIIADPTGAVLAVIRPDDGTQEGEPFTDDAEDASGDYAEGMDDGA